MSKVEIYYFSGTGNSLHVAQEIQKRIPDTTLIPLLIPPVQVADYVKAYAHLKKLKWMMVNRYGRMMSDVTTVMPVLTFVPNKPFWLKITLTRTEDITIRELPQRISLNKKSRKSEKIIVIVMIKNIKEEFKKLINAEQAKHLQK
jgi:hypothetical protein